MRVLLVITGLGMGGAEHVVVNLADELFLRGHQVKIAYLTGDALVLPRNSDIKVISIGMKSSKDFFKAYIKLRVLIKKVNPDVVHSHMFHANLLSRLLGLTTKAVTIISSSHSTNEGGILRMLAYRITDRFATLSTNVSQKAVDSLIEKGAVKPGRMVSVVNGIDTNQFFLDIDARKSKRDELNIANKKIVLAVGRLSEAKDYPNLLNAILILKKERQDFKFLIAGDGPLKEELISLANKLYINDFVEFLGIRRDIPSLMSASDLFVLSSSWEGFGLVVAEAMACERVVVATDCGGVSEVVGSEGFLVEPQNSTLLAKKLNKALDLSDDERADIGASARRRIINNFSLEANVDAYLKLYSA
jgi:glycosyltransferase involved in cell wall biosynthesis